MDEPEVESKTLEGVGHKELCDEFVKGLLEGDGSLLDSKLAAPMKGIRSEAELPEMLLLGDDKQAKERTSMRHCQATIYTAEHSTAEGLLL